MTRVELKTFTYAKGLQSLSIHNAILGPIPKRLLFVMVDNGESRLPDYKPFQVPALQYDLFTLYVNGKQIPSAGLHLDTTREK